MKDSLREDIAPLVGALINVRRRKRDWSLAELGRRTGVASNNIWALEQGKWMPTLSTLYHLAAAFDCEAADLLPRRREIGLD